jgi:hypothetical protein
MMAFRSDGMSSSMMVEVKSAGFKSHLLEKSHPLSAMLLKQPSTRLFSSVDCILATVLIS